MPVHRTGSAVDAFRELLPVKMTFRLFFVALPLALLAVIAQAEDERAYRIDTEIAAPTGPDTGAIDDLARQTGSRAKLTYADRIDGDLSSGFKAEPAAKETPQASFLPRFGGGGAGVYLVVALFIAALLVWLRYGGAGNLLRARPKPDQKPALQAAPEGWAIHAEDLAQGPEALIRRLLALPDRGQAAAGLLRHSLLAAARETQVRLARADTERQAFDRLPARWRQYDGLKTLSKMAELAHYGGRPVSDEAFDQLARIARAILIPSGPIRGPDA